MKKIFVILVCIVTGLTAKAQQSEIFSLPVQATDSSRYQYQPERIQFQFAVRPTLDSVDVSFHTFFKSNSGALYKTYEAGVTGSVTVDLSTFQAWLRALKANNYTALNYIFQPFYLQITP